MKSYKGLIIVVAGKKCFSIFCWRVSLRHFEQYLAYLETSELKVGYRGMDRVDLFGQRWQRIIETYVMTSQLFT